MLFVIPAGAQPAHWSGNDELAFLFEINGISVADSNITTPIQVTPNATLTLNLTINTGEDIILKSGQLVMRYLSIAFIDQPFDFNMPVPSNTTAHLLNTSISLAQALGAGGISLFSGTVDGYISFTYSLVTTPDTNVTISDDFVIHIGQTGLASLLTVSGALTLLFTVLSVFGLLFALDEFQRGILSARRMRGGETPLGVKVFPAQVVLRRRPKKDEKVDPEELKRRVKEIAGQLWDHRRCPKCGKKWPKEGDSCKKCGITETDARALFAEQLAEKVPQALRVMRPKSKMTVKRFSKKVRLPRDKGGALAAALTELRVFQTRSVKVPLNKVATSGMALAGTYFSWLQILGYATPSLIDIFLTTTAGLVISVVVAGCMNWLARVPEMGYKEDKG